MRIRAYCCWLGLAALLSGCSLVVDADQFRDVGPVPSDAGRADARITDAEPTDAGADDVGEPDGGPRDVSAPDLGEIDIGSSDAEPVDAGPSDMGEPDIQMFDAGPDDLGADAGPVDMALADAGTLDAGADAGQPDTGLDAGTADSATDAGQPDTGPDAGLPPNLVSIEVPAGSIPEGVGSGSARGMPVILSGSNFLQGDVVASSAAELEVRSVHFVDANHIVAEVAVPIAGPSSGTLNVDLTVRRIGATSTPRSVVVRYYPEITNANAATAGDGVYAALGISTPITRTQPASWTIWGFTTISSAITLAGGGAGGAAQTMGSGLAGGAAGARGSGGGGAGGGVNGMDGGDGAAGGPAIGNAYVIPLADHLGSGGGGGSGSNVGGDGGSALAITAMHPASIMGNFDAAGTIGDNAEPDTPLGCTTGASSAGGGGSGGSVLIRSPEITGNLSVDVSGGLGGALACSDADHAGGDGAFGRIRVDGAISAITGFLPSSAVTARGPMWDASSPITVQSGSVLTAQGAALPIGTQWVAREQGNPGVESRPAAAATASYTVIEDPAQPVLRLICIGVDTTRGPIDTSHAGSNREHCLWFAVLP